VATGTIPLVDRGATSERRLLVGDLVQRDVESPRKRAGQTPDPFIDRIRARYSIYQVKQRIDLSQRARTDVAGKQGGGAARLLEKKARFVDLGPGDYAAVLDPDAVLLGGQLRGGREAAYHRGRILRRANLLELAAEEGDPEKGAANENHFHPV
jgi:hypothetical protein